MSLTIIKGTILSAPTLGQLDALPGGYLVAEDGLIRGVYGSLPEQYAGAPVEDWGDALILQSFADLHLHAPQYPMLGMGMDLPLLDWLNAYAFPTEARFADTGLRPGDLQPPGPGADCKRHHAGVHVLLSPHGRHADPDGGTGEGRRHRLRGQGEHGPERCPRPVGGDHRGVQA